MRKILSVLLAVTTLSIVTANAQLKSGSIGLTASLLESPNIGLAYAASAKTRVSATFGFGLTKDSTGTTSNYRFNASLWQYVLSADNISNFFGGSVGLDAHSYPSGTSSTIGLTALYGAEYWFSPKFALNGVFQLHYDTGKELGSSVTSVYTSVQTGLTWYF